MNKDNCLHTFAVLAYKESPYLEKCLISLIRQRIKSKIIICTSTQNPYIEKLCQKYHVSLHINYNSSGIANDWNFALREAKTQFVTLAHQDDIYLQDYTNYLLPLMKSDEKSLIGFSDYRETISKQGKILVRKPNLNLLIKHLLIFFAFFPFKKNIEKKWQKKKLICFGSPIPCPSVMYNLRNLQDFSFSSKFSINMDWYAWYTLSNTAGSIVKTQKVSLQHLIHSGSETSSGINDKRREKEDLKMFNLLWPNKITKILFKIYVQSYKNNLIKILCL